MLVSILIAVALAVAAFLVAAALQPADFRVTRTTTIDAPAAAIFPRVNCLRSWEEWSPYDKRDPAMKRTYEGPESGVGSKYTWNGNNQVGEGISTIIESRPNDLIRIDLEFIRPFAGKSIADFTFVPDGNGTAVTWGISGKHSFIARAMCLVMNMDKMIGGDFETGLASLKRTVESTPKT